MPTKSPTMAHRKVCYALLPSQLADPSAKELDVILLKEGESGYFKTDWKWHRDFAETQCKIKNAALGISPAEAMQMVAASMRRSRAKKKPQTIQEQWAAKFQPLVGRTITAIRYLDNEEMDALGIHARPIVFQLDDGTLFWPMRDDEGNDGGVMAFQTPAGKKGFIPEGAPTL